MVIGIKDTLKLAGMSVIVCCAVFVCTLLLNYNIDIDSIKDEITTEAGMTMYNAITSSGKVACIVTGGCLVITSIILLVFYVKNYIDTHGKELGLLKAIGYSNIVIARHFWIFGLSVFAGGVFGFIAARIYMPTFYQVQNAESLLPEVPLQFHPVLACCLIIVPTLFFGFISVCCAWFNLKRPSLDLLREKQTYKNRSCKEETENLSFLKSLKKSTLRDKKILVFFIVFSAFCFSAMTQMAFSMRELSSETMSCMMLIIGLILAFMTLFLSLTAVIKANAKAIAMMRISGYQDIECSKAILNGYRPFSYIGFAVGTVYQYVLLKIVVTVVFADVESIPEYHFNFIVSVISLAVFIGVYELIIYCYSLRIKRLTIKSVMLE